MRRSQLTRALGFGLLAALIIPASAVLSGLMPLALAIACVQLSLKLWSSRRVLTLDLNREPDDEHSIRTINLTVSVPDPVPGPDH